MGDTNPTTILEFPRDVLDAARLTLDDLHTEIGTLHDLGLL